MSNYELRKGKHLTMEDRLIIEYWLDQNYTLKEIDTEPVMNTLLTGVISLIVTLTFATGAAQSLRVRMKEPL